MRRSLGGVGHSFGFTGSRTTISKVPIGPRSNDANHHANPLRPLDCAKPALMSESVNQPTAYSPVFCIELKIPSIHFPVDYKSRE